MKYKLIDAVPEDSDWVNNLTVETMSSYVEASWKAEAHRQIYYKLNRFDLESTKIIEIRNGRAGRISCIADNNTMTIADIHLESTYHGSGLGTQIIKDTINKAFKNGLAVELKCLRTNPVQNLYIRLGFKRIKEDEKRLYYRLENKQ